MHLLRWMQRRKALLLPPAAVVEEMEEHTHREGQESGEFNQVRRFSKHAPIEKTLIRYNTISSIAHVRMLAETGIVPVENALAVVKALEEIVEELAQGAQLLHHGDADIHEALERRLKEKVGDAFAVLRIAKSSNDQDVTDVRLWLRDELSDILGRLLRLRQHLVELAERDLDVVMPGYTHMQPALPILLSHWWLACEARFRRDFARFAELHPRLNMLPLGAYILAGTHEPINRKMVADELCFDDVIHNSVDAISDRDFVVEFAGCAALVGLHLSQLSSELLLWATQEFGFIRLPSRFLFSAPGMPAKRNPELLEILRARPSLLSGRLMEFLSQLKAIPLGYCQDLMESLPGLFDVVANLGELLDLAATLLPAIEIDAQRMREMACKDLVNVSNALAYLVERGISEERAERILEAVANYCRARGKYLSDLELNEWQQFCPAFERDIYDYVTMEQSVASFCSYGGSSRDQVSRALERAQDVLAADGQRLPAFKRLSRPSHEDSDAIPLRSLP